jgi:hypothetical protein
MSLENVENPGVENREIETRLGGIIKQDVSNFKIDLERLAFVLKNRNDNQLNPLVYEEKIDLLKGVAIRLEDNATRPEVDIPELSDSLNSLRAVAKSFGEPRSLTLDEDLESLGQVKFASSRIVDGLLDMKRKIGQPKDEDEVAFVLTDQIDHLVDDFDAVIDFLSRKSQSLREYQGY